MILECPGAPKKPKSENRFSSESNPHAKRKIDFNHPSTYENMGFPKEEIDHTIEMIAQSPDTSNIADLEI